jgi:hypothetical protein
MERASATNCSRRESARQHLQRTCDEKLAARAARRDGAGLEYGKLALTVENGEAVTVERN